jgi:hypothetical protein
MVPGAAVMSARLMAPTTARGAPSRRRRSTSPAAIASVAAAVFLNSFAKFCGWNRWPDQRPVAAP